MAIFDSLIDELATTWDLDYLAAPLVRELLRLIVGGPGGIRGFLTRLGSAGLAAETNSWTGRTGEKTLPLPSVDRLFGKNTLDDVAARIGLAPTEVIAAATFAIPKLVGLLTPGGTIPTGIPRTVIGFLGPLEQGAPLADHRPMSRTPGVPVRRRSAVLWILPFLALVGSGGLLWSKHSLPPKQIAATTIQTAIVDSAPIVVTSPPKLGLLLTGKQEESIYGIRLNAIVLRNVMFGTYWMLGQDTNIAEPWIANQLAALTNLRTHDLRWLFDDAASNGGGDISDSGGSKWPSATVASTSENMVTAGHPLENVVGPAPDTAEPPLFSFASSNPCFFNRDIVVELNTTNTTFEPGSANVSAQIVGIMKRTAENIIRCVPNGKVIEIAGYSDNTGDPAFNVLLSQKRADSVRNLLIQAGVDPRIVTAKGYGSSVTAAPNDTAEGRSRNRRIEYHLAASGEPLPRSASQWHLPAAAAAGSP